MTFVSWCAVSDVGEVDEHAVDGRDRDVLVRRDVARVEGPVAVDFDAFERASPG